MRERGRPRQGRGERCLALTTLRRVEYVMPEPTCVA